MRNRTIVELLNGFVLVLGLDAVGAAREDPYQIIATRNAFGLRAVVSTKTVESLEPPVITPREVKLTGITTLAGAAKVLIQVEDTQTKKTDFPAPLAAGDSYQEVTVLAIDVANSTVRIRRGDVEATLDFINHGVKPAVSALPSSTIPIQSVAHPAVPSTFATPAGVPTNNRSIVTGGQPYDLNRQRPAEAPRIMSREEVEERIEVEREIRRRNNDPTYKLLPSTKSGGRPFSPSAPVTPAVQ